MHGINKTVGVYWINIVYKASGYSPVGLETAFPSNAEQEKFSDAKEWKKNIPAISVADVKSQELIS